MVAPTITPLPPAPLRSQAPATFSATAETFVDALPGLVEQINEFGDYLDTYVPEGGGGGASVTIALTPPVDPEEGDLWWDNEAGRLKIYYDDGSSLQWVDASPSGGYLNHYAIRGFSFQLLYLAATANEMLAAWTPALGETVTFAANFSGCAGKKVDGGTNPAATYTLVVKKNAATVGNISISTGGVVSFSTVGGAAVELIGGTDVLTVQGPAVEDSVTGYAFTMVGSI